MGPSGTNINWNESHAQIVGTQRLSLRDARSPRGRHRLGPTPLGAHPAHASVPVRVCVSSQLADHSVGRLRVRRKFGN
ncbi:hypothetical protein J6590_004473 [Homalodisca vitripennis]|nr:hypothetical protein J6590_004473 [Homalodisca vitripennis]